MKAPFRVHVVVFVRLQRPSMERFHFGVSIEVRKGLAQDLPCRVAGFEVFPILLGGLDRACKVAELLSVQSQNLMFSLNLTPKMCLPEAPSDLDSFFPIASVLLALIFSPEFSDWIPIDPMLLFRSDTDDSHHGRANPISPCYPRDLRAACSFHIASPIPIIDVSISRGARDSRHVSDLRSF